MDADVVVVGAGVVGLACAAELARSGLSVLVLERRAGPGQETSSRNSQVVHAGLYYPPGSLKARLCVAGNRTLTAFCLAHDVPFRPVGKWVVAVEPEEEGRLEAILAQGTLNGAVGLTRVTRAALRTAEPHLRAAAAFLSPSTGILDVHGLLRALRVAAEETGALFAFHQELVRADRAVGGYRLVARDEGGEEAQILARCVVNAAGLESDSVAALAGLDLDALGYRLRWCRGHYFRVRSGRRHLASRLIYPVAPERAAGLGVHVTLDLDGDLKLGPDTEYLTRRLQDYVVSDSLRTAFAESARRYLPELSEDDLSPDQAGIRPKLQGPGEGFRDFVVAEESPRGLPGWVNLVGIESPGLTACLEIAREVRGMLAA